MCLTLFQAIAKDGIIPFLKPFEVKAANGEPIRALGITLCICQVAVLIGKSCFIHMTSQIRIQGPF